MSRAKTRSALLYAGFVVVFVVVIVVSGEWMFLAGVPGTLVGLAVILASPVDDAPGVSNNRFKLPFLVVCAVLGAVMIAVGALTELGWLWIALGVMSLIAAVPAIVVVALGRNPWWTRGWLDYRRR